MRCPGADPVTPAQDTWSHQRQRTSLLLRRVIQHVREQNWTPVGIDFVTCSARRSGHFDIDNYIVIR